MNNDQILKYSKQYKPLVSTPRTSPDTPVFPRKSPHVPSPPAVAPIARILPCLS